MTKQSTITEAGVRRAIKAAVEGGLTIHQCVIKKDEVRLIFTPIDDVKEIPNNPLMDKWE